MTVAGSLGSVIVPVPLTSDQVPIAGAVGTLPAMVTVFGKVGTQMS